MKQFIEAMNIFSKYTNKEHVFHCEHDSMYVCIDADLVSEEDKALLDELGFFVSGENIFLSYKYGSC